MIKVRVLETFTLSKYDEIKDSLISKSIKKDGWLYKDDIFECNQDMLDYLTGKNKFDRAFVEVIEVSIEKLKPVEKKTTTKKETKSKKTIAKK